MDILTIGTEAKLQSLAADQNLLEQAFKQTAISKNIVAHADMGHCLRHFLVTHLTIRSIQE